MKNHMPSTEYIAGKHIEEYEHVIFFKVLPKKVHICVKYSWGERYV